MTDETFLSEEDLYTDDSCDSNEGESDSGSESEDPTFVLDASQKLVTDNSLVSPGVILYKARSYLTSD